jgi:hypothetical protein
MGEPFGCDVTQFGGKASRPVSQSVTVHQLALNVFTIAK